MNPTVTSDRRASLTNGDSTDLQSGVGPGFPGRTVEVE